MAIEEVELKKSVVRNDMFGRLDIYSSFDEITEENIIVGALDKRVAQAVADAVIRAAHQTGVARK